MLVDVCVGIEFFEIVLVVEKVVNEVVENELIFDIGDKLVEELVVIICGVKIILWNGFVGVFEFFNFCKGIEIVV